MSGLAGSVASASARVSTDAGRDAFEQAAVLGDVDERSTGAQPEAPDAAHGDVGEPALDDVVGQRVDDAVGAEREAARRLAHVGAGAHGTLRDHAVGARAASVEALQAFGSIRVVGHRWRTSSIGGFGAQLAVDVAVDHHDRSDAAGADAVCREDGDLTVARGLSSVDAELVEDAVEQLGGTVDVARRSHAHDTGVDARGCEREVGVEGRHPVHPARRQPQRAGHVLEGITVEEAERLLHAVQRFDQRVGPVAEAAHARVDDLPAPVIVWRCVCGDRDGHAVILPGAS